MSASNQGKNLTQKTAPSSKDEALSSLVTGSVYAGVVTDVDTYENTCTVTFDNPAQTIEGCRYVTGALTAPLLGFKLRKVPNVGARVVVAYSNPSWVLGEVSAEPTDAVNGAKKSTTGDATRAQSGVYGPGVVAGPTVDADLLEGEFDISNAMGVGLLFMNSIMSMKAGQRAKVETCLLNDMVRVVSEVFRHHSAFGDFEIYNDGRLNVEWKGTSYEHESYNKADKNEPKANTVEKGVELNEDDDEEMWRNRFSAYLGYLGDFIQLFVHDPAKTSSQIISGRARVHIGNDGKVQVRTTDEIIFEKALRVVVPKRVQPHDSPDGDTYTDKESLDKTPLRKWEFEEGGGDVYQAAFQLRDYVRYTHAISLARFRQNTKDFEVPNEEDVPTPSKSCEEKDREGDGGTVQYFYSTYRIMQDGSHLFQAGDGSCFHIGNSHNRWSSTGSIELDAAGDILAASGRNIFFTAKKNIHFTSVEGSLIQKARTRIDVLVEKGRLWLKSDGKADSEPEESDGPGPSKNHGIWLDSTESDVLVNAKKNVTIRGEEESVSLVSDKLIQFRSLRGRIYAQCENFQARVTGGEFAIKASKFIADVREFNIGNRLIRAAGRLLIRARTEFSNSIKAYGGIRGPRRSRGEPRHENHISTLADGDVVDIPEREQVERPDVEHPLKPLRPLQTSIWEYPKEDFGSEGDKGQEDWKPQAQDFIDTNSDLFPDYELWNWPQDNKLKDAERTRSTSTPFHGHRPNEKTHDSNTPGLQELAGDYDSWEQNNLGNEERKRKVLPL